VAPRLPGDYILEFDVGQERVTWFKDWGSPTLRVRVEVCVNSPLSKRYLGLWAAASKLHSLALWRWLNGKSNSPTAAVIPPPPVMEMHGAPPREITDWVEKCGGKILCVQDDYSAGPYWYSHRYWATKRG
jgi:hypothetical protein